MNIGLSGGTFDPLHLGHMGMIKAALASGYVDRIIVMPSGRPPHKRMEVVSMARYRYEMVLRAFADEPRVTVSDFEILKQGPSYTLDTVEYLRSQINSEDELFLIYGSDVLKDLKYWHEPQAVLSSCPFLLADRGGYQDQKSRVLAEELRTLYQARIQFFPAPIVELSSTQIRQMVSDRQSITGLVPEPVEKLIRKNALYRWQADLAVLTTGFRQSLFDLERRIWPTLTGKRLLHSLNVMTYALHLANIHHVSMEQTAVAALLHDCAKCLPATEQTALAAMHGDPALMAPELVHGPAAAQLAQSRFGVTEQAILNAIQYHTTGRIGMTELDKIIFIADKIEPSRVYSGLEQIRALAEVNLDAALKVCFEEINKFLDRESQKLHPYSLEAYAELMHRLETGKMDTGD